MMSNRHLVPDSINELVERDDEFPSPFQLSFLDPVGEGEEISSIAYSVAQDAAADRGWDISEITINLVAHGSTRRPASRMMTEHHARNLELTRKGQIFFVSYLEEPPFFRHCSRFS